MKKEKTVELNRFNVGDAKKWIETVFNYLNIPMDVLDSYLYVSYACQLEKKLFVERQSPRQIFDDFVSGYKSLENSFKFLKEELDGTFVKE